MLSAAMLPRLHAFHLALVSIRRISLASHDRSLLQSRGLHSEKAEGSDVQRKEVKISFTLHLVGRLIGRSARLRLVVARRVAATECHFIIIKISDMLMSKHSTNRRGLMGI
jgi:hypothetical protein